MLADAVESAARSMPEPNGNRVETLVHDLRALPQLAEGREIGPIAAVFHGRTMQSTVESGAGPDARRPRSNSERQPL